MSQAKQKRILRLTEHRSTASFFTSAVAIGSIVRVDAPPFNGGRVFTRSGAQKDLFSCRLHAAMLVPRLTRADPTPKATPFAIGYLLSLACVWALRTISTEHFACNATACETEPRRNRSSIP